MSLQAPTRALALLSFTAVLSATAGAQLQMQRPPQIPTSLPATASTTPLPAAAPQQLPAATPIHRAEVTYTAGRLTVSASNSSLNQILREIGRITAMKITGGVNDERVFGTYGPDTPATVLTDLLDGTGSNLLIIQASGSTIAVAPVELVLTPRHGGPTPPNPSAPGYNDANDNEPDNARPMADSPFRQPPSQPAMTQPDQAARPNVANPANATQPDPAAANNPSATTQEQSPNGVKTPQQIYEQLLRLRNQIQTPTQ